MAKKPNNRHPFAFTPIILDQDNHEKRRVIKQLPGVHQTETLQKFFGSSVDHLFDPGKGKPINGYVGQKPLWYDPDQDYYLEEGTTDRTFYQLEASMVSRSTEGTLTDLLPYADLINQLRFQGGIVNNHNRLFSQDYYTWCPPIDVDKIVNFRQYVWLPLGEDAITLDGPTSSVVATGSQFEFWLPGYGPNADTDLASFYDLSILTSSQIQASVDGVSKAFTYEPGANKIRFNQRPAADSEVKISVYSDLENNAIGLSQANSLAFAGLELSSGMRVKISRDINTDFKPDDVYIIEGVGTSIELIKEESSWVDNSTPDYLVMARGAKNRNEWSSHNRWFHISTLPSNLDSDFALAQRATRPIIEFNRDLELFNYGLRRRYDVDMVIEDVEDFNALLNQNPTQITLNGVTIKVSSTGLTVQAVDPATGITYGDVESFRIMVRNTVNQLLNNNIFVLVKKDGILKLILETDGENPSGEPVYGEVFRVKLGTHASKNLFWNGSEWQSSQHKAGPNQAPLFELYDLNEVSIREPGMYPNSTFQGSKIFGYQVDSSGTRPVDPTLGFAVVHDNKGQILFENFLNTQTYEYVVAGISRPITGFYFHKVGNINPELETFSNDWFKAPGKTKQFIVDRFVADGRTKLFTMSQAAEELHVTIGRSNSGQSFERITLQEDRDFIRVNQEIMIFDVTKGDIVEIKSFNSSNPPVGYSGHYEVPLNLQANPDNVEITELTKGDFYDHFAEIIKNQVGFSGAEYSSNNYRDTPRAQNLGSHIIQHSAGLLKLMLLASQSNLDLMSAIRFSEAEYSRFKDKFHQKVLDYNLRAQLLPSTPYDVWINTILDDLNKGKTKKFPFYLSGMAQNDANRLPTFIPATPSFIGVYPLYTPEIISQELTEEETGPLTEEDDRPPTFWFVRGHDGSLTQAANETVARVILALELRIFDSVPAAIRNRERPLCDWQVAYGDHYRSNDYSYEEYLQILRPTFERWAVNYSQDYRTNDTYDASDPWSWNWSSIQTVDGSKVPGNWRGIYEKFFGTQRPDLTPWESLGFTVKPTWWEDRYGSAPYTSENLVLWDDLEAGYIHQGPRKGINPAWARPGIKTYLPVDTQGRLRHPGPRWLTSDAGNVGEDLSETELLDLEYESEFVLGCGICPATPLEYERAADWDWGDIGPVELAWRRSSNFAFAVSQASYLMKPAAFVEMGWNTRDLDLYFKGTPNEQWLNQDTKGRPSHKELQVHGEVLEDFSLVTKVGVQQWISDHLTSRNTAINENFADKVRGLGSQICYKIGGFTDASTLVAVSDAFGRVPSEDITVSLYRSPSVREEMYSGVAIQWNGRGYEVFGYEPLHPYFPTIAGNTYGSSISVGETSKSQVIISWRPSTYYSVNLTVKHGTKFYRCLKTHTSSSVFETEFWTEVARPHYADGNKLEWYLESEASTPVVNVPYGTVFRTPQEVANFLNGYDRYLKTKGWVFEEADDLVDIRDWRSALAAFVLWSSNDDRQEGDFLTLSPCSSKVKFKTDQGSIQPLEQIVNGLYAIVDHNGKPIDPQSTRVVRSDGEITVVCTDATTGIFGLRLYISEIEHVLVFSNQTIFGDTIYSPLLNIKQPRLRLQGFRTVGWKGRIDAPGFIVTGDTLTPNFERAADDFRRFFEVETMENKNLQDRARANFGYEEREYLNNLLLTPTNQFEFYQGMIQQKGSSTSMRRLLRSNFVRHNKGLKLFEEWAFRVGDYGGQEVQPSLDIQIKQSEFKHNPQLIKFTNATSDNSYGVITISDPVDSNGKIVAFDDRWIWRPDMISIKWPTGAATSNMAIPTAGYVKLDEVKHTVPTLTAFDSLYADQLQTSDPILDNDRVWVYGIGEGSPQESWSTYKFKESDLSILDTVPVSFDNQKTVVVLDNNVKGFADRNSDPDGFHINQYIPSSKLDNDGYPLSEERLIINGSNGADLPTRMSFVPKFQGQVVVESSGDTFESMEILTMMPEAGMFIKSIKVHVLEPFSDGSSIIIGHENDDDYFLKKQEEEGRQILPATYENEAVLIETPDVHYISDTAPSADVKLIRVGRVQNFCAETIVEWKWIPNDGGSEITGSLKFMRPSDYDPSKLASEIYQQTLNIEMPNGINTMSGTLEVDTNGEPSDSQTLTFIRANIAGVDYVNLSNVGVHTFDSTNFYPKATSEINGKFMLAQVSKTSNLGKLKVEVEYFYSKGFELTQYENNTLVDVASSFNGGPGTLYSWVKARYASLELVPGTPGLWEAGDIIEVDQALDDSQVNLTGLWAVYAFDDTKSPYPWRAIRRQNPKINSDLLESGGIFNSAENKLKLVLQLYDPVKGYIPGPADRELDYKTMSDPAHYSNNTRADGRWVWGKDQVGQLWWDLSAVRYLDYEIYDTWNGSDHEGVNYRWKNWGRIAPGSEVNVYEWVRSTVPPSGWNDFVASKATLKGDRPSGTIDNIETTQFISTNEWNDETQTDEVVYYFWVKNATTVPANRNRKLTAQQVSNIITNPTANDIPFFAAVDTNKLVVGGIKQFLGETDTVLKIKWKQESSIVNNHHKQWIILREEDERNTITDELWNKMRDSIVGWDANKLPVPDEKLPVPQQVGALVRPRQSWFPADKLSSGQRPSRAARKAFVESMNDIMSKEAFLDQWHNWADVFDAGDPLPSDDRYVIKALDIADLKMLLPAARNAINPGECVLIENTVEAGGFWTLWKLEVIGGVRTFILEDFQKWRLQEGELWNLADWYKEGWSAKNFPNYRFPTYEARDAAGNLDITLLKGTLVQIDEQSPSDGRWSWDVYTSTTKYQVAKANSTIKLADAFYDEARVEFGPKQVSSILEADVSDRITPDRIQELSNLINYRDGSAEIEFLLNKLKTMLFNTIQKNNLFFSMVKSAFHQSKVVDWAFKTSFLYLGGYSETLRQSPVAFKDQIDNVIAYLEEVKPYHVKIREYVRRLSYGPDLADLAMTDFDKPVYPDGQLNRVLDPVTDQAILSQNRPWKDWYDNYTKTNFDLKSWDADWNPIRKAKVKIKFDRVSCGVAYGWDVNPWDPMLLVYNQTSSTEVRNLSALSELYRSGPRDGSTNYFNDTTVETMEDRNLLVRTGIVTSERPGTIVTVLSTGEHFMWTGDQTGVADVDPELDNSWIKFEALGWEEAPDMGAATRIMDHYNPEPGMVRADDPNLIDGCEFGATVLDNQFVHAAWDIFEWGSTGISQGLGEHTGIDIDTLDGSSTNVDESEPEFVNVDGNTFTQPDINGGRPRELVVLRGIESLIFTVHQNNDGKVIRNQNNALNQTERFVTTASNGITFNDWDTVARILTVTVPNRAEDGMGYTLIHDPKNPSTGFVRDVALSKGYIAKTSSKQSVSASMTFKLTDLENIPAGLIGNGVRIAILNPTDPTKRVLATVGSMKGNENDWNGTFTVSVDSVVDLGSSKTWNIVPIDLFNEPGVIWIDNARFTYTDIEWNGNVASLVNAMPSGLTLQPMTGTVETFPADRKIGNVNTAKGGRISTDVAKGASVVFTRDGLGLVSTTSIYDGSKHRQVAE